MGTRAPLATKTPSGPYAAIDLGTSRIRATPAGKAIKVRITSSSRPISTAWLPQRAKNRSAMSSSPGPIRKYRPYFSASGRPPRTAGVA